MDQSILQNIIDGDANSFKILYDAYFDKALRTAVAITKNKEMAKDALQETFIRVYLNITSYDINKPFEPWFYRILINECNRLLKKTSMLKLVEDPLDESRIIHHEELPHLSLSYY